MSNEDRRMLYTKVIANGKPNELDVHWGLIVKIALWTTGLVGAVGAVVLSAGVLRVFEMSSKLDVVEARQLMVLEEIKTIRSSMAVEDYVTHDEMLSWLQSDARRGAINAMVKEGDINTAIQKELNRIGLPKK